KLARDAVALQAPCVGVPGHGLLLLGLAEALQKANPAPVGVECVHIVDDDELIAVAIEPDIHAEGGGVALDPAGFAVEDGPDRAALGQSPGPDQDQEMEVPLGEGPEIFLQPVVSRDVEGFLRISPTAVGLGRHVYLPQSVKFRAIWHQILNGKWHRPRAYDSPRPPNPIRPSRLYQMGGPSECMQGAE